MYKKIYNPKTKKFVNINSKTGRYLIYQYGGVSQPEMDEALAYKILNIPGDPPPPPGDSKIYKKHLFAVRAAMKIETKKWKVDKKGQYPKDAALRMQQITDAGSYLSRIYPKPPPTGTAQGPDIAAEHPKGTPVVITPDQIDGEQLKRYKMPVVPTEGMVGHVLEVRDGTRPKGDMDPEQAKNWTPPRLYHVRLLTGHTIVLDLHKVHDVVFRSNELRNAEIAFTKVMDGEVVDAAQYVDDRIELVRGAAKTVMRLRKSVADLKLQTGTPITPEAAVHLKSQADPEVTGFDRLTPGGFLIGARVIIHGLVSAPQHNGSAAVVLKWLADKGRFELRLAGEQLLRVKPANLIRPSARLARIKAQADAEWRVCKNFWVAGDLRGLERTGAPVRHHMEYDHEYKVRYDKHLALLRRARAAAAAGARPPSGSGPAPHPQTVHMAESGATPNFDLRTCRNGCPLEAIRVSGSTMYPGASCDVCSAPVVMGHTVGICSSGHDYICCSVCALETGRR